MFAVPELPPVIKRDKDLEEKRQHSNVDPFICKDSLHEKHKDAPVEDVKAPAPNSNHKIIILYTKEVENQDLEMIRRHGKVIFFNRSLINVDLKVIDADYVLCDADDQDCLNSLEKHFNNDLDNLHFCCYCRFYEKPHYNDNMNCFSTFKDAANKEDFDFLLLNKKNFKKVNSLLACASYVVNLLADLKK